MAATILDGDTTRQRGPQFRLYSSSSSFSSVVLDWLALPADSRTKDEHENEDDVFRDE